MLNPPPKLDTVDVRSIRRWLNALRDYVASLPSRGDMKTIRVNGGTISAVTQPRISQGGGGGGGVSIYWGKITSVINANNYTCEIYYSRANVSADETGKAVYVYDLQDSLAVYDFIPVQASQKENIDYECIQQIGLL